jgi:hypothetical protein
MSPTTENRQPASAAVPQSFFVDFGFVFRPAQQFRRLADFGVQAEFPHKTFCVDALPVDRQKGRSVTGVTAAGGGLIRGLLLLSFIAIRRARCACTGPVCVLRHGTSRWPLGGVFSSVAKSAGVQPLQNITASVADLMRTQFSKRGPIIFYAANFKPLFTDPKPLGQLSTAQQVIISTTVGGGNDLMGTTINMMGFRWVLPNRRCGKLTFGHNILSQ